MTLFGCIFSKIHCCQCVMFSKTLILVFVSQYSLFSFNQLLQCIQHSNVYHYLKIFRGPSFSGVRPIVISLSVHPYFRSCFSVRNKSCPGCNIFVSWDRLLISGMWVDHTKTMCRVTSLVTFHFELWPQG
jgi:hypothetical protein